MLYIGDSNGFTIAAVQGMNKRAEDPSERGPLGVSCVRIPHSIGAAVCLALRSRIFRVGTRSAEFRQGRLSPQPYCSDR